MKLWRVDAEHESGDGAFTLLYRNAQAAEALACKYAQEAHGWLFDIYEEDVGDLDASVTTARRTDVAASDRLCNHLWPVLPIAELVALVNQPVAAAREQLDSILAKRKGVA